MDQDLKNLIESPEFGQYHKELQKTQKFNPFDVLRYADYEIRHSNVLAWLLQSEESHGLGDKFLRQFIQCLNPSQLGLNSDFSTDKVRVERERDYVDITIFLNDARLQDGKRLLIAIENKVVELYADAIEQALGYEETLHKKHASRYRIQSVLLTTSSSDGRSAKKNEPLHVSWSEVRRIVTSLLDGGHFGSSGVREFIRYYLDVVERMTDPPNTKYLHKLLDTHRPVLNRLLKEREPDDISLFGELGHEYRATLDRLICDFRQTPADQRAKVKSYLESKGAEFYMKSGSHGTGCWLYLYSMKEVARALNIEGGLVGAFTFTHGSVTLEFYFPPWTNAVPKKSIIDFMNRTPVDRSQPPGKSGKYPMEMEGGYFFFYRHRLLGEEEVSTASFEALTNLLYERIDAFLYGDYERIKDYFRCLAFDPKAQVPADEAR